MNYGEYKANINELLTLVGTLYVNAISFRPEVDTTWNKLLSEYARPITSMMYLLSIAYLYAINPYKNYNKSEFWDAIGLIDVFESDDMDHKRMIIRPIKYYITVVRLDDKTWKLELRPPHIKMELSFDTKL